MRAGEFLAAVRRHLPPEATFTERQLHYWTAQQWIAVHHHDEAGNAVPGPGGSGRPTIYDERDAWTVAIAALAVNVTGMNPDSAMQLARAGGVPLHAHLRILLSER